jgi:hypothetical protein
MDNRPEPQPYTAAQIRAYLSGNMTGAEMHALEKAALGDPLLAEAIEGYRMANGETAYEKLNELKRQIKQKPGSKGGWIPKKFMRMAATLALIVTLAATAYLLLSRKENDSGTGSIAENRMPENTARDTAAGNTADAAGTAKAAAEPQKAEDKALTTASEKRKENPAATPVEKDAATLREEENNSLQKIASDEENVKNKSVRELPQPPAVTEAASAQKVEADNSKNAADAAVTSEKEEVAAVAANEVKKSGLSKRERKITTEGLSGQDKVPNPATPAGGRANYDRYLASSISLPQEIREKYRGRSVKLGFTVRRNGKLSDIRVLESVSQECDAEAIRLLKTGPAWDTRGQNRARTTISVNF